MTTVADQAPAAAYPSFPGRGRYLTGLVADAVGTGVYLPFSIIYFHQVAGQPLAVVGGLLTAASVAGLLSNPVAGALTDRFGARRVILASYLVRAAGFLAYIWVSGWPAILAAMTLVALGEKTYAPAMQVMITELSRGVRRERMLAVQRTVRNAGFGLGGLIAAMLLGATDETAMRLLVAANAVSFVLAAVLFASVPLPDPVRPAAAGGQSYRSVARDRVFLRVTVSNVPVALCYTALNGLLPLYVISVLHGPALLPGVLLAINTALVVVAQVPVSRLQERCRRTRSTALGATVFATACAVFAVAYALPAGVAVVTAVVVGTVLHTCAELIHTTAARSLAADVARPGVLGRYLAVYQLSHSVSSTVAPALFTALVVLSPPAAWLLLMVGTLGTAAYLLVLEPALPAAAVRPARSVPVSA